MRRRALLLGLAALPALAGCGTNAESVWAPDDVVARARFRDPGPTHLALVTVRNEDTGNGAHSALLNSASERVLFDPFGGWKDPAVPERNDVLHGFSPQAEARYLDYQAQDGYYYVRQEVQVTPAVAEQALALAKGYGPVGMALCSNAIADVLSQLPGFEPVGRTLFPDKLSDRFAGLPGVTTTERHGPPRQ